MRYEDKGGGKKGGSSPILSVRWAEKKKSGAWGLRYEKKEFVRTTIEALEGRVGQ